MTKVLYQLGLAGRRRQEERARLPVAERQAVVAQHPAGAGDAMRTLAPALQGIDVAGEDAGARSGVGPMTAAAEDAAEGAHLIPRHDGGGTHHFFLGDRRTKSSAISFMVTNRTPGWPIMWWYSRSSIISTCGRPDTSGWMVMGNTA